MIFWISFDLFTNLEEFQDRKLHLLDVIALETAKTPDSMVTILPVALLLALLYALTHHSRYNEITAMRAAGVSLWRICVPYFIVGLIASVVLFALNEILVPRGMNWANHILSRYVQKSDDPDVKNDFRNFGFTNARAHRTWFVGEYHKKNAEMIKPQVEWTLPDGASRRLYADRAIRINGVWTFFNAAEYSQAGASAPLLPSWQTNVLAMPGFDETPKEIESEIKIGSVLNFNSSRKADIPLADIFAYLQMHPNLPHADARKLFTKFYGRLAAPWTCLVVVLIAIPFSAASGRRNLFFGVAGSIFICFSYFVLQSISLAIGSSPNGHLPASLAAWLPNLFFGAAGLILTARVR